MKDSLNPMFNREIYNIPKAKKRLKPNNEVKVRKKRSDVKNDVKIPLSLEERQIIKELARKYRMSPTQYCSQILATFLRRKTEYRPVDYVPTNKKTVHAKLNHDDYDLLFQYSIKWDCSLRQAAHRILMTAIRIECVGVKNNEIL